MVSKRKAVAREPPPPTSTSGARHRRTAPLAGVGPQTPDVQAPTGFGKTLTAAHIVAGALGKGKRVAFCVPRLTLIDQTVAAFESEDREAMFDRLRCGETKILCNVGILTTGLDLPMVSCLIDAQPTKSRSLFVQKIGRGLRTAEGKDKLLILDHGGTCLRLGLPTDIQQTHLDDGSRRDGSAKKERSEPLPKLCPECKALRSYKARQCSECNAPIVATSMVHEAAGDLVEIGSRTSGKRSATPDEKEQFYARAEMDPGREGP
jgi:superfamily II DNA or RNA helicase